MLAIGEPADQLPSEWRCICFRCCRLFFLCFCSEIVLTRVNSISLTATQTELHYIYGCVLTDSRFLPRCMECSRGMAMGILSVRLSDKRVHCDKMEESYG